MKNKITDSFDSTKLLSFEEIEKLDFYELCYYLENLNKISKAYDNILKVENRELKEKNNG